jgi:hypothetical protein
MSHRSALVGPFQKVRADTINEAVNVAPFLEKLQRLNVPDLWYSSTVQSGVGSLEIIGESEELDRLSQFVAKRITFRRSPELMPIFALVTLALRNQLGIVENEELPAPLSKLERFLVELLLAAHRKQNLIYFEQLPDMTTLIPFLSAELILPLRNLFSALVHSAPVVAGTQSSLELPDLALFEELIAGKVFRQYEHSHSALDDNGIAIEDALEYVRKGSRLLVAQNPRLLKTKRVAVSLLPITSKIVDVTFGKLPGTLAGFFADALTAWLQEKRRVVIYQFNDLLEVTMTARVNELIKAKGLRTRDPKKGKKGKSDSPVNDPA